MQIVTSVAELRQALAPWRGRRVGFAPTMGFLHAGHQTLFRRAAAECDVAVTSIFVNPTQFNDPADLERYPRDPEGDARKAEDAGIGILWMPGVQDLYPSGETTRVMVHRLTDGLCGAFRPGHFEGVATVVAKLLNAVAPTHAYFGEKDYQQLAVIRRMAIDLLMDVTIVGVPTVREPDGLAMSSRNVHLSPELRQAALAIPQGLARAQALWAAGERRGDALVAAVSAALAEGGVLRPEYITAVDPDSLQDVQGGLVAESGAVIAVAAFAGSTRLIDNARVDQPTPGLPTP
jgi:pantoate--beta-alanine ligase